MFVTPAFWSVNYLVARASVDVIPPHSLAFWRWLTALAVMLPFCWQTIWQHRQEVRRDAWRYLVLGALGMWICGAFVYIGGETSPALNISLIYAVSPALVAVGSIYWFGERMGASQIAGALLALVGVLVIILKADVHLLSAMQFTRGDFWIVTAVLSWTVYSLLLRHWRSSLDPFARLTVIVAFGALVLAPFAWFEPHWAYETRWSAWTVLLVLAVALFPGFGAYQAYSFVQSELGAARAGLVLYLGPPYSALAAWAVLAEALHWYHLLGAALILPGIYLAGRRN